MDKWIELLISLFDKVQNLSMEKLLWLLVLILILKFFPKTDCDCKK